MNPKDVPERQGSKLREMRKSLGLTQSDVASMLLVSTFKIGEIERGGKRYLNLEDQYCKALERLMEKRASSKENPAI